MIVRTCLSSLIKFAQEKIQYLKTTGVSPSLTFLNLDTHANISNLDPVDYLVFGGFSISEDEKIFDVSAYFGCMTYDEPNLLRHYKILDYLYDNLKSGSIIPVYDADTNVLINQLNILNGTTLVPVNRAEHRSVQLIHFSASLGTYS